MRSDALLGALVVMFVVLLTCGIRVAGKAVRTERTNRSAALESGERVRLLIESARRTGVRAGS